LARDGEKCIASEKHKKYGARSIFTCIGKGEHMNTWAIISVLGLIAIVVIANWKDINAGVVGFAMAMLLATVAGLNLKDVYSSFNTQLFLRLLGMQVLIVIARGNGTMKALSYYVIKLCSGKRIRILPLLLYFGMGIANMFSVNISTALIPMIWALSAELGYKNHLKLGFCTMFTTISWSISPYSVGGQVLTGFAEQYGGYAVNTLGGGLSICLVGTIMFLATYFFMGWHKMESIETNSLNSEKPEIGRDQILTALGFVAFVVANIVFKLDMMVTPIIVSIILICLGCGDGKKLVKEIPWNSLIMIGGMSVYVGVVQFLGGADLFANGIAKFANAQLAPGLICFICAFMSLFTSGSAVIAAMVSTIPALASAIPGLNAPAMFFAIFAGASSTGISPMSTLGAQSLAYYAAATNPSEAEYKQAFNRQFIYAIILMVWCTVAGFLGLYGIFL